MLGGRTSEEWVAAYATGHTHPVNRMCHSFGIPMIVASLPLFLLSPFMGGFWRVPVSLFTDADRPFTYATPDPNAVDRKTLFVEIGVSEFGRQRRR